MIGPFLFHSFIVLLALGPVVIFFFPAIILEILHYSTYSIHGQWNIDSLKKDFDEKLFDQHDASKRIIEVLMESQEEVFRTNGWADERRRGWTKTLLLVGGPGVGKTYLTSIMKDNFVTQEYCQTIILLNENEKKLQETRHSIATGPESYGGINFIIIDGMNGQNMEEVSEVQDFIKSVTADTLPLKKKVLIIIVVEMIKTYSNENQKGAEIFDDLSYYKEHVVTSGKKLLKNFADVGIDSELIIFNPMSLESVKKCINYSVKVNGRKFPTLAEVEEMLKNIAGKGKRNFIPSGCKDVDAFVALLPIENVNHINPVPKDL